MEASVDRVLRNLVQANNIIVISVYIAVVGITLYVIHFHIRLAQVNNILLNYFQ